MIRKQLPQGFRDEYGALAQKKEQFEKYGEERGNAAIIENLRAELAQLATVARA